MAAILFKFLSYTGDISRLLYVNRCSSSSVNVYRYRSKYLDPHLLGLLRFVYTIVESFTQVGAVLTPLAIFLEVESEKL